jgi:hypothetical protein
MDTWHEFVVGIQRCTVGIVPTHFFAAKSVSITGTGIVVEKIKKEKRKTQRRLPLP